MARRKFSFGNDETTGAIVDASNGAGSQYQAHQVYFRVTVTTGATVPDGFGLSSYDFGTERLFFGKPVAMPTSP